MRKFGLALLPFVLIIAGCSNDVKSGLEEDVLKIKEGKLSMVEDLPFEKSHVLKTDNLYIIKICNPKDELLDFKLVFVPKLNMENTNYLNAGYTEKTAFGKEEHEGYKTLKAFNFAYQEEQKIDFLVYLSYNLNQSTFEGYFEI